MKILIIISTILGSIVTAAAQNFSCPPGQSLVCNNEITYGYDNVGNRILRSKYCYCAPPPQGRLAQQPAKDSAVADAVLTPRNGIIGIHPNPTTTAVIIDFAAPIAEGTITVCNEVGQQVASFRVSGTQAVIDIANQPTGVYLFSLLLPAGIVTRRVVKTEN
jgi:hypothetical protein